MKWTAGHSAFIGWTGFVFGMQQLLSPHATIEKAFWCWVIGLAVVTLANGISKSLHPE